MPTPPFRLLARLLVSLGSKDQVLRAFQVMLLLPTTDNVRQRIIETGPVAMVTREWGILDAMGSPGRQGDIAREEFESMKMVKA